MNGKDHLTINADQSREQKGQGAEAESGAKTTWLNEGDCVTQNNTAELSLSWGEICQHRSWQTNDGQDWFWFKSHQDDNPHKSNPDEKFVEESEDVSLDRRDGGEEAAGIFRIGNKIIP